MNMNIWHHMIEFVLSEFKGHIEQYFSAKILTTICSPTPTQPRCSSGMTLMRSHIIIDIITLQHHL